MAMTTSPASFDSSHYALAVSDRLAEIRHRIALAGGDVRRIGITAVTKGHGCYAVTAAQQAGLNTVGENYLQELVRKRAECDEAALRWHFLGAVQSRKIPEIVKVADVICGVSRLKEIDLISERSPGHCIDVQVDCTGLVQRNGAVPRDVPALVAHARGRGLTVRALMTVASPERSSAEREFGAVAALASSCDIAELSMGMSDDLEWAVAAGTTELRIGRALFGPRMTVTDLT